MAIIQRKSEKATVTSAGSKTLISEKVPPGKRWKILTATIGFTSSVFPAVMLEHGHTGVIWTVHDAIAGPTNVTSRSAAHTWRGPFIADAGETVEIVGITNEDGDVVEAIFFYIEEEVHEFNL